MSHAASLNGRPRHSAHVVPSNMCCVAAIVVTWNRKHVAETVLREIANQHYAHDAMDIVIIDNGSTDGTADHLIATFSPETVVDNPTHHAHKPLFSCHNTHAHNSLGVRSLTLIRNGHNHGGCGGFNTGLRYVDRYLANTDRASPIDYAWLVDDDVELPPGALSQLVKTAEHRPTVGLVGSRAVNMHDRKATIETTVYFDFATGRMCDTPPDGHPLQSSHREWIGRVGGTRGERAFSGQRDVDIASACSLLARWRDVREVGFWDQRFFIYCDDADWCLRFKRAGRKVVCDLDAVVYHTPWFDKLTPARLYYAQRNAMWVTRKAFTGLRLKRATAVWYVMLLRDAMYAIVHRRLFHAHIIMRTLRDAVRGCGGKLANSGPTPQPVIDALHRRRRVVCLCSRSQDLALARSLHDRVRAAGTTPQWIEIVRNDVPHCEDQPKDATRIVYAPRLISKVRRQLALILKHIDAVVVFDQVNDVPLIRGSCNIHVDSRSPDVAQIERAGPAAMARACVMWVLTAIVAVWHTGIVSHDTDERTRVTPVP